jgi:hypothetical protein
MKKELSESNFHKNHIEIETNRILNEPQRLNYVTEPFMEDGIIQNRDVMETLLSSTVQKIILDPFKHLMKKDIDLDNVDAG